MIASLALVLAAAPCGWVESKLLTEGNVESVLVTRSGAVLVSMRELGGGRAGWVLKASSDDGVSWAQIHREQFAKGDDATQPSLVELADGTLLAGQLWMSDSRGTSTSRLLISKDGGRTWKPAAASPRGQLLLASGSDGRSSKSSEALLSTGEGDVWTVEASGDLGATWKTIDRFAPGPQTRAAAIIRDASGAVLIGGFELRDGAGWVVRRSLPDGGWRSVDQPRGAASVRAFARAGSTVWAAGTGVPGESSWIVRRSDDGEKWVPADAVRAGWRGGASSIAVVPDGGVVVAGTVDVEADGGDASRHWVVRASRDGVAWNTIDDVAGAKGGERWADRVVVTPRGVVLVFGGGFAAATNELHQDAVCMRRWACGPVEAR